jgi:hypothetical protein
MTVDIRIAENRSTKASKTLSIIKISNFFNNRLVRLAMQCRELSEIGRIAK